MDNIKKSWSEITISDFIKLSNATDEDVIKVLSGKDEPKMKDYLEVAKYASFLHTPPQDVLYEEFEFKDWVLCPTLNPEEITAGQFIDLIKQQNEPLNIFLSAVLIPKGKAYNEGYFINKLQKDLLDLTMDRAYGFFLFYEILYWRLFLPMIQSLEEEAKEKMKK